MNSQNLSVEFFETETNKHKLELICKLSQKCFVENKKLLILVPSLEAAHYIDQLLWKHPQESFLPHVVSDLITACPIAITMQASENVNCATYLLNLTNRPAPAIERIEWIYEFVDKTNQQKNQEAEYKKKNYEERKAKICFTGCTTS